MQISLERLIAICVRH